MGLSWTHTGSHTRLHRRTPLARDIAPSAGVQSALPADAGVQTPRGRPRPPPGLQAPDRRPEATFARFLSAKVLFSPVVRQRSRHTTRANENLRHGRLRGAEAGGAGKAQGVAPPGGAPRHKRGDPPALVRQRTGPQGRQLPRADAARLTAASARTPHPPPRPGGAPGARETPRRRPSAPRGPRGHVPRSRGVFPRRPRLLARAPQGRDLGFQSADLRSPSVHGAAPTGSRLRNCAPGRALQASRAAGADHRGARRGRRGSGAPGLPPARGRAQVPGLVAVAALPASS